ncbi:hypothetical protein AVEN_196122-1 [Araneus ventricosus]|uniref:Uncharacterized protein n=1 Tax=Araneus ventricosus TaxID=182803 RepID=A0A4Y2E348_ARAVE|nr:hypothetical protein AVEN_196122-1 [Araneus ventricosus]
MLSDVILLHDNTHIARRTQELMLCKPELLWSSSSGRSGVTPPPPYRPESAPNLGSKHLSGTRFSLESDLKTVVENWLNRQDVISAKNELSKLVLRSDKCLNRFGKCVTK